MLRLLPMLVALLSLCLAIPALASGRHFLHRAELVKDINVSLSEARSEPTRLTLAGDEVFFWADDGVYLDLPWTGKFSQFQIFTKSTPQLAN